MVVVYSLIGLVIMTPLSLELGKRRTKTLEGESGADDAPLSI